MENTPGLSKSRLTAWRQCPKRLWLQVYHPELLPTSNTPRQLAGYEVGELARRFYPDGVLLGDDLEQALQQTQQLLGDNRPLFEATFAWKGLLVRVDILLPTPRGWRMIEVKSSAGIKPYHLEDCAIQAWVLQQNGVQLASIEIAHINTGFIYLGDQNYQGILSYQKVDHLLPLELVPDWLEQGRLTLQLTAAPELTPGRQCDAPYPCPFKAHCGAQAVTEPFPLDVLHHLSGTIKAKLRAQGINDARLVPIAQLSKPQRWIQHICQTGIAELKPEAAEMLRTYSYPRYYFDFEAVCFAIPRWSGTSPHRSMIPFQWSCHIETAPGQLQHAHFIDTSGADPRRACAESMILALGQAGPIFVYSQVFEKTRIGEFMLLFPDLAPALRAINQRIVDLLPITRAHYYHPAMLGSWSLKNVLPTIAPELDYSHLNIRDGQQAQDAYSEILHPTTHATRRAELIQALERYCAHDTYALVKLAWFLQQNSSF